MELYSVSHTLFLYRIRKQRVEKLVNSMMRQVTDDIFSIGGMLTLVYYNPIRWYSELSRSEGAGRPMRALLHF
jgi:hypothetical protein